MIRINEICEALKNVCGWEQSYDPAKAIDDNLTQTESGLYFQGAHPLLTLDNMAAIMPDDWGIQYPVWDALTQWKQNKVVQYGNDTNGNKLFWKAKADNVGEEPTEDSLFWSKYNILSDFLERMTRNGIATAIQTFTQIKQLDKETRNLLERRTFFDGAGRIRATLQNNHKLVGFEIVPVRAMGVTAKIEKIGLQMTGGTGVVRMYLFHSSQIDPIKTFDLNFTVTNGGFQWFPLTDCYLPYISDKNNAGGAWFLCYNQDELPAGMEAINVSKDWSREPCGTCNMGSVEVWRELTKYLQVTPFMYNAPETFAEYPELWDIAYTMYTRTQNYGLNCEITIGCDLTDFIISQRQIFQTVIQRQVAAIALRTLAMNPNVRVNRNQSNATRMDILYELDGNTSGVRPGGLGYDLKKSYEALQIDTQGLDRICLACNNRGVRYRTV
ncbi:hypothetical protein [Phocaeicola vulgatus]|uniref:hypothetical protein n=1 Tax=Phocaeicola vulgatus TaxID=821 RepID=UPI0018AB7090|nr:hypothetical protein [Phocaeicola vulgatus]